MPILYKRARHVVSENQRVKSAAHALQRHDIDGFGELMRSSHRSLRDDYEVSCRELDVMVEIAERQPGTYGSRMTGGGFGGCTINLVDAKKSDDFQNRVAEEYKSATGITPDIYLVHPAQGLSLIHICRRTLPVSPGRWCVVRRLLNAREPWSSPAPSCGSKFPTPAGNASCKALLLVI